MTLSPKAAKTVIIGLISRSVIKPEHVHRLITAWADSDPTSPESAAFWRQIFEAQGATQALRQNIRNPQMVRLLTLRAILCPDTFPEYLNWLQPSLTSRPKSEPQATAEQFLQGPWSLELQQLKDQNPEIAEVLDESRRKALGAVVKAFPNAAPQATSALWAWDMPEGFWQIQPQGWDDFFETFLGRRPSPALERFCLEVVTENYDSAFASLSRPSAKELFLGLMISCKSTLTKQIGEVWEAGSSLKRIMGLGAGALALLLAVFGFTTLLGRIRQPGGPVMPPDDGTELPTEPPTKPTEPPTESPVSIKPFQNAVNAATQASQYEFTH